MRKTRRELSPINFFAKAKIGGDEKKEGLGRRLFSKASTP